MKTLLNVSILSVIFLLSLSYLDLYIIIFCCDRSPSRKDCVCLCRTLCILVSKSKRYFCSGACVNSAFFSLCATTFILLLFRARFACLSKVVVFCGTFECTGKGYVERELLSLRSRERRSLFRALFTCLSKVVVLVALLNAPVRGMWKGNFSCFAREREESTYSGLALLASQKWWFWWHF